MSSSEAPRQVETRDPGSKCEPGSARNEGLVEDRHEATTEAVGVIDDVATGCEQTAWLSLPVRRAGEREVGVPVDVARAADPACSVVGEPAAGDAIAVPEADDASVVEDVVVPGAARIAGQHRQPDGEHLQLCVRMSVEDVLADPTGPEEANTSGRAHQDDQPRLPGGAVEGRAQLPDVPEVREPVRRRGSGSRSGLAGADRAVARASAAAGGQARGQGERKQRNARHSRTMTFGAASRRHRTTVASSANATIPPAAATRIEPRPSARRWTSPEKRTPKLTTGSSATVALSPHCRR